MLSTVFIVSRGWWPYNRATAYLVFNSIYMQSKKPLSIIIGTAVVVLVVYFFVSTNGIERTIPGGTRKMESEKSAILKLVGEGRPLTEEERARVFASLGEEKITLYNFTDAEREAILEAMNRR